jgi:hypothetical protein
MTHRDSGKLAVAHNRDRETMLERLTGKGRANGAEGSRLFDHVPGNRGTDRFDCRRNPQLSRSGIIGVQIFRWCKSLILQIGINQEIWKVTQFSSVGGALADRRKGTPYQGGWLRFGVFFARRTQQHLAPNHRQSHQKDTH